MYKDFDGDDGQEVIRRTNRSSFLWN